MKTAFVFFISVLIMSCGAGTGETSKSDSANPTQAIINGGTGDSSNENGSNLIATNDCLTCHKIDEQAFGPSYRQIANKYDLNNGNVENLAARIISGGKGLWGNNAMTPHPNLTTPKAETMVRYILSLRDTSAAK